ncbi:MAG: type II toxin-antitoxin system VapC family toxin [Methanobrevibacter sp.]|uniref:type II toxin-antitoxin system VapC family toxin n=1 Tax=Methanobrevibacter sp. TaxID=66852 RepID=UPI002E766120|nr:type II toxin-antitoxin system VapC family toxin [Methanobrevibacter sp.]MEE0935885.1 type II toxin-antitoxin system VapC family toxin [Methanobrevibacter sp.]
MSKYFFDSSFIIALALDNDSNKSKALELTDLLSEECYIGDNVIEEVVNVVNLKGDANKAETLYNFMMDNFKIINEHEIPNYNTKTIKVFKKFNGKLSYTDSSMIVTVLEYNIDFLVTFDKQFKREERITVLGI